MTAPMAQPPERLFPVEIEPKGPFPLLIGLEGPPGAGKTYSALRIAHGIQRVLPGPIVVVDTEAGRSAQYWKQVNFHLLKLEPPYRSLRFLGAIQEAIKHDKPAVIVIDTMSEEHEGIGGVLDFHDQEVDRISGGSGDQRRREAVSLAAWVRPKRERTVMMTGLLRITTPMIFTFRAREKTRPTRIVKDGRTVWEPTRMGYQAIAPAEICHGMTCMCLLPPHADGVPNWKTDEAGIDFLLKRPNHLAHILTDAQLSEDTGEALAHWAAGTAASPPPPPEAASPPLPEAPPDMEMRALEDARHALSEAAKNGTGALMTAWRGTGKLAQRLISKEEREHWKTIAAEVDMRTTQPVEGSAP